MEQSETTDVRWLPRLYPLFLAAVILGVYWSSLSHMHRGDQWWWLVDVIEDHTFTEVLADSYSYPRTRKMAPGDTQLYRPLFFLKFAIEKTLFGNNYALWQFVGVGLHFLVCWMLHLNLLQLMRHSASTEEPGKRARQLQSVFAYLLPLFVATNAATLDAIIWAHINGYLLLYGIVLSAFYYGLRNLESLASSKRHWVVLWLLLTTGSFVYEYGQFYGPIVGIALAGIVWPQLRNRTRLIVCVAFCLIPILYQSVNRLDRYHHTHSVGDLVETDSSTEDDILSFDLIERVFYVARYTIVLPHIPYDTTVGHKFGRILVKQPSAGSQLRGNPAQAAGVLLMLGWFAFSTLGTILMFRGKRMLLLGVWLASLSMMALYFLGLVIVRVHAGSDTLVAMTAGSYYIYWPFLLSVLMAYIALLNMTTTSNPRVQRSVFVCCSVFAIWFSVLILTSANILSNELDNFARYFDTERDQQHQIEEFIAQHANEEDFSILFDVDQGDEIQEPWGIGIPWTTILFREYESYENPNYILHFENEALISNADYSQEALASVSYLVETGTDFNIYRRGDHFYGVVHFEGRYSPKKEYRYLIEGASITEIREQIPAMNEMAAQDTDALRIK